MRCMGKVSAESIGGADVLSWSGMMGFVGGWSMEDRWISLCEGMDSGSG